MAGAHDRVKDILTQMLRDEVDGMKTLNGDDWQMDFGVFETGDRVYLRCACYKNPQVRDYTWEVQDQTSVELDITDCPKPSDGATAVVECDVVKQIGPEQIQLGSPKIVAFEAAEQTVEALAERL